MCHVINCQPIIILAESPVENRKPDQRFEGRDEAVGLARGPFRNEASDRKRPRAPKAALPQQLQHCPRVPEEQKGEIPRADTAIISVTDVTIDLVED